MSKVEALAIATVDAPVDEVLAFLRDYEARPRILTDNYTSYRVEPAGADGPVIAYHFVAGGRERDYRLRVEDTQEGMRESDELSSFVSTWTVAPFGEKRSEVKLQANWDGAGGIAGFFEARFAPLGLRRIYSQVLDRLASELKSSE